MNEAWDDRACIQAARAGQREAFGRLVERYRRPAYFAALALVRSPDDALDVAQDSFIRAYRAIGQYDVDQPFYPWLRAIVRNVARSWLAKRRPESDLSAVEGKAWTVTPDMLAERSEDIERVRRAMSRLDEGDGHLLYLKHFEALKYRQIAEVLDVPMGTVMSRLFAARQRLRRLLEDEG